MFKRLLDWLFDLLKGELQTHSLEWCCNHGGKYYMNTLVTFVVDGTEQKVNASDNRQYDALFFSGKKSHHSINILLFIALDGTVLYLSSLYPGSFNDSEIIKKEDITLFNN